MTHHDFRPSYPSLLPSIIVPLHRCPTTKQMCPHKVLLGIIAHFGIKCVHLPPVVIWSSVCAFASAYWWGLHSPTLGLDHWGARLDLVGLTATGMAACRTCASVFTLLSQARGLRPICTFPHSINLFNTGQAHEAGEVFRRTLLTSIERPRHFLQTSYLTPLL